MKILAIAANTLREALRERLMYNLVVFGLLLIAGSLTISQLTLGEQFRIIADISTSSTQAFGTLIAVFLGVALVSRELDRRTCYAILARPVSRAGFIVGKYLGLLATLALNVLVMALVSALMLFIYTGNTGFLGLGFLGAFGLMMVQLAVCAGFAVLFATLSTPTLAVIFTLSVVGAGHAFSEVRAFWLQSSHSQVQLRWLVRVLDFTLPNMGLLDVKEALTYGDPLRLSSLLTRFAYGAFYAAIIVSLAALVFSRKDVR
jgi:ABC-type transport system involved in multi-copper enzyme maturation permease subunit